jgi:hypothetical protein
MNITLNDYNSAARVYEGRKDKVLGRKIRSYAWMKYDPEHDCFVLSEVFSKYRHVTQENGFIRYEALPKEQWDIRPYAEIYRDRIVVLRVVHNNYLKDMGLRSDRSKTVKLSGRTWTHFRMERRNCVTVHRINGDVPVTLKDGRLSTAVPPKERVVNNDLRIEMNRMIRKVRQLLTVRAKLGAFDSLTHGDLIADAEKNNYASKWRMYRKPKEFLKLLQAVTEDDITSFYPILWMSDRAWYVARKDTNFVNGRNVVQLYNNLINSMREHIRRELGVVQYVEVADASDERGADRQDGQVEAARS